MNYYAGIDVGSLSADCVILQGETIVGRAVLPTGANGAQAGSRAYAAALEDAGLTETDIVRVLSTGYSRKRIGEASSDKTEIACHAKGMFLLHPDVRTLIDIGGQDSKAIRLSDTGKVLDFAMNEKCAAGTGRFLEVMAHALHVPLDDMGDIALKHQKGLALSSTCTVFAESEVVSLVSHGEPVEEITYAIANAIAHRTAGLAKRVGIEQRVAMSGGVAQNKSVVDALEKALNVEIVVPESPQLVGALGAALYAQELHQRN